MIFDTDTWQQYIDGYAIRGCAAMDDERIFFLLVERQDTPHRDIPPTTRFLFARLNRPIDERRFIVNEFDSFGFASIAYANQEFLGVDMQGRVFRYDARSLVEELPGIDTRWLDGERRAGVSRVKRVLGRLYALAMDRFIFERLGPDAWRELPGLSRPRERLSESTFPLDFGFRDLSAFAPDDMYAAGGSGDVWHFDGSRWSKCAFPSDELLFTVCCGGDGRVYLSGNGGSVWVGRKDDWSCVHPASFSIPFRDSVWFDGGLWLGSDYGLWLLQDRSLIRAPVGPDVLLTSGALDVTPDGQHLITAGNHGASIFDGRRWRVLFNDLELERS